MRCIKSYFAPRDSFQIIRIYSADYGGMDKSAIFYLDGVTEMQPGNPFLFL